MAGFTELRLGRVQGMASSILPMRRGVWNAMTKPTGRRRDPTATRAAILDAALTLLARDGAGAVSLSGVAQLAGVNRGTAYQHFETREKLIAATIAWVSDKMFRAVFGDAERLKNRRLDDVDMVETTERMAGFAIDNPELCRMWLLQVLASDDPSTDRFWREFAGSIGRFAGTHFAEPDIDVEVLSIIALAGSFLWPIWARAKQCSDTEKQALAQRFAREMLRLCMYGSLNAEALPQVATYLKANAPRDRRLRIVT
jgi:AcrR family transcriptional regulator